MHRRLVHEAPMRAPHHSVAYLAAELDVACLLVLAEEWNWSFRAAASQVGVHPLLHLVRLQ